MARVTVRAGALRPQNPGHVYGESRTGALVRGPGRGKAGFEAGVSERKLAVVGILIPVR